MFENIENYYIVRISNIEKERYDNNNVLNINYEYACVKVKNGYYSDAFTNERYNYGLDLLEKASKFIDSDYSLVPLTEYLSVTDMEMTKEHLLKLVNIILNELNENKLIDEDRIQKQR